MAEQAAIDAVKLQLIDELDLAAITDISIGAMLDAGLSETKVILANWRIIAGKLVMVADVSESGSSRQLGVSFDKATRMIELWQAKSDAEDAAAVVVTKKNAVVHTAIRV